jgi:hypothetical protein
MLAQQHLPTAKWVTPLSGLIFQSEPGLAMSGESKEPNG